MSELKEKGKEIIELITKFYLNELDSDWVKNVINADFTEVTNIPLHFEDLHSSTNFLGLFDAIINTLRQYVDLIQPDSNCSNEGKRVSCSFLSTTSLCDEDYENTDIFTRFWISMTKVLNVKSLLAFLFYYIHEGQHYDANEHNRELGIHAASLYFLLLALPGSNAFRIFHPVLYLKSLDILRLTTKLNVGASSPKKGGSRGSRPSQRKSSDDVTGEGNEDEDAELSYLSPNEASKLIRSLNILLNDFLRLSNRFSLKHSAESLDETISILVEVTRCEIHNAQGVFLQRHTANSVTALTYNAYVVLQSICNPLHGNIKKTVILIMKYMMYNILMISRGSSDLSTRALGVIREHSVIFVKYLMIQLKKETYEGVYILIQHLCLRVPDKADFREKTAKSVLEILKNFPLKEYSQLLKWLFKFSHNEKAGHRLFTLEVISKLLTEEERQMEPNESSTTNKDSVESNTQTNALSAVTSKDSVESSENSETRVTESFHSVPTDHSIPLPINRHVLSHKFLLCIIFSRCRDSAATVRSKALALLSECTLSNNPTIIESMKQIFFYKEPVVFTTPHIVDNEINCESPSEGFTDEMKLPNAEIVMSMLQRRALDDRVTVRKSALQVMENVMKLNVEMITANYLKVLVEHCRDPALLIRKQMVHSLTSVVEAYPSNEIAIKTWVSGVLPLILDPEIKVQEKVIEFVDQLIFHRMSRYNSSILTAEQELPWKILDTITMLSFHKFFNKILMMWSKSDRMSFQVISIAKTHIGGEFSEQSWTFLSLVSQYVDVKDPLFALKYFEENFLSINEVSSYTLQQVLKVLGHSVKYISPERAFGLQRELLSTITSLSVSVELISPMVDIVSLISYSLEGNDEKGQKAIEVWAAPILKSCDEYLKQILFPEKPSSLSKEEEERFFRYLFTLGEVAQLCPSKVNKRMFLMMQSIIFHQNHTSKDNIPNVRIPSTQTQSSQPLSLSFNPTRRLKTLAVITLGKMCLQHEDQAKRIIPAMGRMLDTTTLPAMKINIIIVLSDMCVRYATLVDPLMPQVTACLRDPDIQVRRTTLTLLINLLQEDYLKLKGSFFYRILQCLCDDDEEMRRTVVFFMTERLLKRFPKIFLQHFIECIFHYNCYEEHESYNKFNQSKQEKQLFSLAESRFRDQRMMLYRFMLDHMLDDQRFAVTQKLCQDVLGGVVDGRIKLTHSSLPMLEDTLMVLSSDEIKLAWLKSRQEDADQPTDQAEQAEMAGIAIKKTIISQDLRNLLQVVKRNVIENIVPILIALKHKLAENRSPLMKQLLLYFKEIMKDYKNEVKEILAGNRQLAKEIEFDLRKLEEEEQKELERVQQEREKELECVQQEREKELECIQEKEKEMQLSEQERNKKIASLGNSPKFPDRGKTVSVPLDRNSKENEENQALGQEETENGEHPENSEESPQNGEHRVTTTMDTETENDRDGKNNATTSVPSTPLFKKNNISLLKQALINSQKKTERRRNLSTVSEGVNDSGQRATPKVVENNKENGGNEGSPSTSQQRMEKPANAATEEENENGTEDTIAESPNVSGCMEASQNDLPAHLETQEQSKSPSHPAKDKTSDEDRSNGSCTPSKQPSIAPSAEIRENLMRAISTPNSNQNVISNITFINKSHDISCITIGGSQFACRESEETDSSENPSHTLLLHFKSPEAFAKEEQFSQLRRNSKKCLSKEFDKESIKKKQKKEGEDDESASCREAVKRPSGGFMESFRERDSFSEDDSSITEDPKGRKAAKKSVPYEKKAFFTKRISSSKPSTNLNNLDSDKSSKRTLKQASLSPVVQKNSKKSKLKSKK